MTADDLWQDPSNEEIYLTDGGLETSMIFHEGLDLPHLCAFDLLRSARGRQALHDYFARYAKIANERGLGFILDSATWRASPDWGLKLGYGEADLAAAIRASVRLIEEVRTLYQASKPMILNGAMGPRGDGYQVTERTTPEAARDYHAFLAGHLAEAGVEMLSAITMTNAAEAAGIALAARDLGLPVAVSFTVETDGRLPSGETLKEAITFVDRRTDGYPAFFMINCAHPSHFWNTIECQEDWVRRIRGLRANASALSHAELDDAKTLDDGDALALGASYRAVRALQPQITVLGGCCGTDHRHLDAIGRCCAGEDRRRMEPQTRERSATAIL